METLEFQVSGMVCHGCEQALEMLLRQHPAVTDASADAKTGRVNVVVSDPVERSELVQRIESAGFSVEAETNL